MADRLPALFVSHGPPTLPLEDIPARRFLAELGAEFPRPRGIVAVSAHWETEAPAVTVNPAPETIHDFYGFPAELYAMRYAASGDPILAERVAVLLEASGFPTDRDPARGLDHGAWTPLSLIYPDQDVPVIQLSIQTRLGAAHHVALGEALAPLRAEGVLILASGNLTHNLMEWRKLRQQGIDGVPEWVTVFQEWVADRVAAGDVAALADFHAAPEGTHNHPTDEHFLPLFVALGAGGGEGRRLHESVCYSVLAMDAYSFG